MAAGGRMKLNAAQVTRAMPNASRTRAASPNNAQRQKLLFFLRVLYKGTRISATVRLSFPWREQAKSTSAWAAD